MFDPIAYRAAYNATHKVEAAAYREVHREEKRAYDKIYTRTFGQLSGVIGISKFF